MPRRIERDEALERIKQGVPSGTCPMCHLAGLEVSLAFVALTITMNRIVESPLPWSGASRRFRPP